MARPLGAFRYTDACYGAAQELLNELHEVRAAAESPGEAAASVRVFLRGLRMKAEAEAEG